MKNIDGDTPTTDTEHLREGLPDPNHPLLASARENDACAEEHGFSETCSRLGIEPDVLIHIAEQRALMLRLHESGHTNLISELHKIGVPTAIALSEEDDVAIQRYTLAAIDGILLGWNAAKTE